ncbi:MAG: 7-cyano-7-deazaguanine synthase QueC [Bdellovibrionota bacterium]
MEALVLFSGGQDSTTSLLWAKERFSRVHALSFDYGQRHRIELECAQALCKTLDVSQKIVDLTFLSDLHTNALTSQVVEISLQGGMNQLPSTFVPGRNALFLTVAAAYGVPKNIHHLVLGACEVDYSGYPDCRQEFVQSQEKTLSLACDTQLTIHTPLMNLTKAQTFEMADQLGGLDLIVEQTHTCYHGERKQRMDWGYGCGTCPACTLRKNGYEEFVRNKT